jgi:ParB family chromosome partitioning protein
MTDTTTTHEEAEAVAAHALGELAHLDPNSLDVGENVREYANVDKPFLDSIAEHGVLVPITAIRRPDGKIEVRNGQRRTVAALKLGLSTVPVYVVTATAADSAAETIERIAHQIVSNDQKRDLSDAQRARGIQQMIDSGLSVARVAKKLSVSKDTIKAAETAAKSSAALEALDGGQISLTEAAVLTEFEQDGPQAIDRLVAAARTPRFEHVVSQLRAERAEAEAEAKAVDAYTSEGFTVLDERPDHWDPSCVALRHLVTADDEMVDEDAVSNPAHWAVLLYEDSGLVDVATGELVDEESVDWATEDDPDATPEEGKRHTNSVTDATVYVPEYFCLDAAAAGLTLSSHFQRNAGMHDGDDPQSAVNLDGDDREAARLRAEAEQAEAQKRERRIVVNLNKLGAAATEVRREFVKTLLSRKTLPKGAATFVADALLRDSYMLTQHDGPGTAAELLGIEAAAIHNAVSDLPDGSDNRASVITLGLVLGCLESRCGKDAWRNPAPVREPGEDRIYYGRGVTSGDYLRVLVANGYVLSPVEQVVTGTRDSAEVYDEYLAETGKQ